MSEKHTGPCRSRHVTKVVPADAFLAVFYAVVLRFFMIERTRAGEELREEFKVLGSTGNVSEIGARLP
jgi:hypothetical protein